VLIKKMHAPMNTKPETAAQNALLLIFLSLLSWNLGNNWGRTRSKRFYHGWVTEHQEILSVTVISVIGESGGHTMDLTNLAKPGYHIK
jgi:hypothetical protein